MQHRHHQAGQGLRGDAQVHGAVARHRASLVVVAGVHLREVAHRQHHRACHERQQGQLAALGRVFAVQLRAQGFELGHVDFLDVGEMRDAPLGLLHLVRDHAAQPDHGDSFFLMPLGIGAAAGSRRRPAPRCQVDVEVLVHDAAGRAAAVHVLQFDAQVPGTAAHGRRGDGLVAGGAGRWRLGAGRSAGLVLHRGNRRGNRRGGAGLAGCGRGRSRHLFLGRRGRRIVFHVARAFHFQADEFGAHGHLLAHRAAERHDLARYGRRNFHRGLVGHHVGQDLVFLDGIARLHMPGHQFDLGNAFADVRHLDHMSSHGQASIVRLRAAPTRSGPGKYAHSCA